MALEKKFLNVVAEFKALSADAEKGIGYFEGYGSIFGNKDSYGDVVEKGAFAESLKNNGLPAMLWQHRADMPIGVYTEAREDEKGLYLKGEINLKVQKGVEAYELLKQGALKGMSIGFFTEADEVDRDAQVRRLKKLNLLEVSIVTFPANKLATVTGWKNGKPATVREFEKFLQGAGFGRKESTAIASGGFKSYLENQRDADDEAKEQRDADYTSLKESLSKLSTTLKGVK